MCPLDAHAWPPACKSQMQAQRLIDRFAASMRSESFSQQIDGASMRSESFSQQIDVAFPFWSLFLYSKTGTWRNAALRGSNEGCRAKRYENETPN